MSRYTKSRTYRANKKDVEQKRRRGTKDAGMSAHKALKAVKHSNRIKPAMRRICPTDWNWDEEKARMLGTEEQGYYKLLVQCPVIQPEDAEEIFLHHNWFDGQRKFDDKHAERLSSEIVVAVDLSFALGPDNYPRLVNGQHTLWAMFMSGRAIQATVSIYVCRDEKSMANLYSIFDSNKTRSTSTIIDTYKKTGALHINHSSSRHNKWAQCVACAENEFTQPKKQQTNATKFAHASRPEVQKFANWIESLIDNTNQIKGLIPMGVGASFYAMYRADPVKAGQFIQQYLKGVGLTDQHPILVLRNRLTINKPVAEHGATACRMHSEITYTCWRKFCLNEPLLSTRRTKRLPKWDNWMVYRAPESLILDEK